MSQLLSEADLAGALGAWTLRSGPLYARLADAIADAVAQGGLEPDARLPAERPLADRLGVSRGTVVAAYAALADRGVVTRRQGSGTTVAASPRAEGVRHHRYADFNRVVAGPLVPIDLALGAPPLDDLLDGLSAGLADAVAAGAAAHGYVPLGLPGLRTGVAELLTRRGVPTEPEEILITAGAQGAIQLITSALVRRGDRVVVESPTYPGALEVLSRAGAAVVGVPRDHAGMRPEAFARALGDPVPALALVVPTCHNPTGTVMDERRRRELLAEAGRRDVLVVEDLTLADLTFTGDAPPPLVAMRREGVIAIGSFSKVLWGGLRTGWIRADRATILRLGRLKAAQDLGSGLLDQAAVLAALPRLDEYIAARRHMLTERHAVLREALAGRLPEWETTRARGGYSLWVRLPGASGDELTAAALRYGVAIASGAANALDDLFLDHVRLCFAAPEAMLEEAVERLVPAWREVAAGGSAARLGRTGVTRAAEGVPVLA